MISVIGSKPKQRLQLQNAIEKTSTLQPFSTVTIKTRNVHTILRVGNLFNDRHRHRALPTSFPFCTRRIVAAEEADVGSRLRRSKSGALALEIANSCGLCRLEIGTQHLSIPRHGSNERSYLHDEAEHTARSDAYDAKPSENSTGGEDSEGSAAATAAILISEGGQAGEGGVYLAQRINNAVLEGVAWSLAGGGTTDGVRQDVRKQMDSGLLFQSLLHVTTRIASKFSLFLQETLVHVASCVEEAISRSHNK